MRGMYVDLVRNLRDTVRARRQDRLREVELTWSDHDLDNFRVFAMGLQPAEMADVCYALADTTALPLIELLADYAEANEDLRRTAFQSLAKTPVSARLYIAPRLLSSNNPMVRAAACDMLAGVGKAATEPLAGALHDASSLVSAAAIRGLVKIGGRGAGEKIAELMRERDPDVCAQALNAMIRMEIPAAVFEKDALAIFADKAMKNDLRKTAARALASGKSAPGRAAMLEAVAHAEDADIRRAAAEALGSFSDRGVVDALITAVSSESPALAVIARQSLSRLDPEVKLAAFKDCLAGTDAKRAAVAASFLGEMRPEEAEGLLCDVLAVEERPPVVLAVAESLGKSGFPRAWDALKERLLGASGHDESMAVLAALADTVSDARMDEFAALADDFPGGQEAEFILRRIAGFYRAGKTSRVAEAKALEALDLDNRAMAVPAVEILALSGRAEIRNNLLAIIAEHESLLPVRRVLKALLRTVDGELAPLFRDAPPETSVLLPTAVRESDALGPGGVAFMVTVAGWAKRDLPGAREGLALAAVLDPGQLCQAMPLTADRAHLLAAWASLDERERLRNSPDWNRIFDGCPREDKLLILDTIDKVKEEYHLRAVAMLAFTDPDADVKARAVRLVEDLVRLDVAERADAAEVPVETFRLPPGT